MKTVFTAVAVAAALTFATSAFATSPNSSRNGARILSTHKQVHQAQERPAYALTGDTEGRSARAIKNPNARTYKAVRVGGRANHAR